MPSPIQVIDGGLGTTLEDQHAVKFTSADTPLWSGHLLLTPGGRATLLACHKAFAAAPVDLLTTATYQLSAAGLAASRTEDHPGGYAAAEIPGIVSAAVGVAAHALQATGNARAGIALSLGPYGATMVPSTEYSGAYTPDAFLDTPALEAWHAERLALFLAAPNINDINDNNDNVVSYLAFETIPRVSEIRAVRSAMSRAGTPTRYWMSSVVVGADDNDNRLPDGSTLAEMAEAALSRAHGPQAPWGIGVNCCKCSKLPAIVAELTAAVDALVASGQAAGGWPALVLYPDGTNGEVYDTTTQTWKQPAGGSEESEESKESKVSWAARVAEVAAAAADAGKWAEIVAGGCCKARPEDIGELSRRLAERRQPGSGHGE